MHANRRAFLLMSAAASALALAGCVEDLEGMEAGLGQQGEDARLLAFFSKSFTREFEDSPEFMTSLGVKKRYGEWDDRSDAFAVRAHADTISDLEYMRRQIARERLSPSMRVSYDVFLFRAEQRVANWPYRFHNYEVSHFGGPHQDVPSLLVNRHRIDDVSDAQAYIARIAATPLLMDQTIAFMREAASRGITLPRFSYALIAGDARNVLTGAPFDGANDNTIFADFKSKVARLSVNENVKAGLVADAAKAMTANLGPAYTKFLQGVDGIAATVKSDHGVARLPNGAAFYDERTAYHTTLKMPAAEIHRLGRSEVARLSADMEKLKAKLGFRGPLKAFYADLRTNPRYLYPETPEGRSEYLAHALDRQNAASAALSKVFGTLPKAGIDVKRMEPFLEGGRTIAFYSQGTPDGSRPGHVAYNLRSMAALPKWQLAALAFHEGIPGHHLQISIAQETQNIPDFRKHTFFTAYVEGWALYTETLSAEMGLYRDHLDEVGRITMELWRACRLVVDTGIHTMGWSRKKAVDYFLENTALTRDNIVREIDRYFVYPGQACAYQIGKNRILELRERARASLGPRFDLRRFHDAVLENGAVPLPVLENIVAGWVQSHTPAA